MMWLWISLAMAGPAERVTRLLEAGRVAEAVDFGETWIEKHTGDVRADEVNRALENAVYQRAILMNTTEAFQGFREQFPDSKHIKRATELEARAGWDHVSRRGSTRIEVENWVRDYDHIIHKPESLQLLADRAYAETRREDTAVAWRLFQDDFPYDERVTTAEAREDKAAYREMRDAGSKEAYVGFLEDYPQHEHHALIARDLIRKWGEFTLPCSGSPPACPVLPAGTVLDLRWEAPPNYQPTVRMVALFGTETRPIAEAFGPTSTARTGWSASQMAAGLSGELWADVFRLTLPFDLYGDLTQTFALEVDLGKGKPAVFPFSVRPQ